MGNDDWYLHYGLDRDPFVEGGVQGLFYPGGARQETVEQLQHLARFGDSVLLVAGAAGAGKSTTLAHFVAQCASDTRCAVVEIALLEGPEQLMQRVLAGFGLPVAADPGLVGNLQRLALFCEQCRDEGMLSWVVFDDAQHLHADALALFAPLLERLSGRLRLVFFAEKPWSVTLRAALPATIAIHLIELMPFERDESAAYLHYRLKTAGLESEPPFSASELEDIHRLSGGMPGRINALARQLLIDELEIERQPLAALPLWHLGVVVGTLLLLGGLYAWSLFNEDGAKPVESLHSGIADEVVEESAPVPLDGVPATASADADADAAGETVTVVVEEVEKSPEKAPEKAPAAVTQPPTTTTTQQPVATPPPTVPNSTDEEHLLALDGSRYVLQIMASDDLQRLQRFAAQQSVPLRQYSKLSNGRRWYALVHGDYPDQASAERVARELGPRLGGNAPWVRPVEAVQREIRAGRVR